MLVSSRYFIKTDRLGFRHWRKEDTDMALRLWGDYEVTKLLDAHGQLSENHVRERLAREIATEKKYGVQYWPIFLLKNDEHIGGCGLRPYDLARRIYEIGLSAPR